MGKRRNKLTGLAGYRVDLLVAMTQTYAEYTALKKPVTMDMAESYARGLKRQGQGGRIVAVPSGAVIEVWATQASSQANATPDNDIVQAWRRRQNAAERR